MRSPFYQTILHAFLLFFNLPQINADTLSQSLSIENKIHKESKKSQSKINHWDDATQKMLDQYRAALQQTKTLTTYNTYLQTLLKSQLEEKESLQEQLKQIEITQQEIVPLILNMQKTLAQFVQLDLPFLPKERKLRIKRLETMIGRADITHAEKFRQLIEAYQIENDYGQTIEAYRSTINQNGQAISVDFLRLGRVALYYQKLDGSETGFWNQAEKHWQILSDNYRHAVRQGLRIARKEVAPDLLTLPLPLAKEANQ